MSRCVVVLGMHRSGTSMVSGILQKLGIFMGERFRDADAHNENGYFEDLDWRDINKAILMALGGTWYNPPRQNLVDKTSIHSELICDLIESREKYSVWGFKDPRTCITIPIISKHLPNPLYVYVRREPRDVVMSLMKRAQLRGYYREPESWLELVNDYERRIKDFLSMGNDFTTVTYEQITEDPDNQVMGLAYTVGIKDKDKICEAIATVRT